MEISKYQALAMRTAKDLPRDKAILHFLTGVAGELGEIADRIKKTEVYNQPHDLEHICEEIGDLIWYAAYGAYVYGMSLETICRINIEKLAARYPEGYTDFHAAARLDKEADDGC